MKETIEAVIRKLIPGGKEEILNSLNRENMEKMIIMMNSDK